jgi:hypothetical protein
MERKPIQRSKLIDAVPARKMLFGQSLRQRSSFAPNMTGLQDESWISAAA